MLPQLIPSVKLKSAIKNCGRKKIKIADISCEAMRRISIKKYTFGYIYSASEAEKWPNADSSFPEVRLYAYSSRGRDIIDNCSRQLAGQSFLRKGCLTIRVNIKFRATLLLQRIFFCKKFEECERLLFVFMLQWARYFFS